MFLKKAISALEVESLQLCFSSERNARAQFGKGGEQCQFTVLGRSEELRGAEGRTGFRMHFKTMQVLVSFPVALIKSSDKGNLRREGFILAHCSRVHHDRKSGGRTLK